MPPTTFAVCNDVNTTSGGTFTWVNPYPEEVKIEPSPVGSTWPLTQPFYIVPKNNGQTPATVNQGTPNGTWPITVKYNTSTGGNPCATRKTGNPKILVGTSRP